MMRVKHPIMFGGRVQGWASTARQALRIARAVDYVGRPYLAELVRTADYPLGQWVITWKI